MSSYSIQALTLLIDGTYMTISTTALVAYEFLITIQLEIDTVWKRPWTATSVLLLSTRWVMVLSIILNLVPHSPTNCMPLMIFSEVLFLLADIQVALFSSLRVFALWEQNYVLSAIVFILEMVPFATNLFNDIVYIYLNIPVGDDSSSCTAIFPYSTRVQTISLVAGDALVLFLTWGKTFSNWNEGRKLNMNLSVSGYLLRDGALYFLCLLIVNVTHLVNAVNGDTAGTVLGPLQLVLPPILICRFMINLRSLNCASTAGERTQTQSRSRFSALGFRVPETILGNIGESLVHGGSSETYPSDIDADVDSSFAREEDGIHLDSIGDKPGGGMGDFEVGVSA